MFHLWTARSLSETLENKSHDTLQGDFPHNIEKGKGANKRRQKNRKKKEEPSREQSEEDKTYAEQAKKDAEKAKKDADMIHKENEELRKKNKELIANKAQLLDDLNHATDVMNKMQDDYRNYSAKLNREILQLKEENEEMEQIKEKNQELQKAVQESENGEVLHQKNQEISNLKQELTKAIQSKNKWFASNLQAQQELKKAKQENILLGLEIDALKNEELKTLSNIHRILQKFKACKTLEEFREVSEKYAL